MNIFTNSHARDITLHNETVNMLRDGTLIHEDASSVAGKTIDDLFYRTTLRSPSLLEEDSDNWSVEVNFDSTSRSSREYFNELFDYTSSLWTEVGVDNSSDYEHYTYAPSPAERSYYLDYTTAASLYGNCTTESTNYHDYRANAAVLNMGEGYGAGLQLSANKCGANMTTTLQDVFDSREHGTQLEVWEHDESDTNYTFAERLVRREYGFRAEEAIPRTCSDGHHRSL